MPEERVGVVNDYFAKIGVAGIDLEGALRAGDTIHIKGHTTDLRAGGRIDADRARRRWRRRRRATRSASR